MSTPVRVQGPQPAEVLMQLATGYMVSSALYAATKLRIADLLKDGAKPIRELAAATETNEDAVYRMLRALASVGVFIETAPRAFALTAVGETLRADRADSFRDMVLWMADRFHYQIYAEMLQGVKTGKTVVEKVFGEPCFEHLQKDQETGDEFNAAMTMFSKMLTPAVLDAYDFSWLNGNTLVDVGGGHGYLLTAILGKYPEIHGVIFDLEHIVEGTRARVASAGLAGRCGTCPGDFFAEVPAADAYIMKHIIHDWSDEKALAILRNCHRAGRGETKVILLEAVLTPGNDPSFAKWLDLEMLLIPGGRERTEEEFASLFERAGFALSRVVRTKSAVCVLEAARRA
jgi:O-methyltransferase domain/Dimerisation domain